MQVDGKWIEARLTKPPKRGEKTALARAMGIKLDQLSKILKGERQISTVELPGLLTFFGESIGQTSGFEESAAEAYVASESTMTLIRRAMPHISNPATYKAKTAALAFGILQGDVLILDMKDPPANGDVVIASLSDDETGIAQTVIRRMVSGSLISADPSDLPIGINEAGAGIYGPVKGTLRGTTND